MENECILKEHTNIQRAQVPKIRGSIMYMYCLNKTCPNGHHFYGIMATGVIGHSHTRFGWFVHTCAQMHQLT